MEVDGCGTVEGDEECGTREETEVEVDTTRGDDDDEVDDDDV